MRGRILIVAGLMLFLVTVLGIASADEVDTWEGFDQYYLERFGEDHYSLVFDTISPEEAGDLWEKWHREGSADTTTPLSQLKKIRRSFDLSRNIPPGRDGPPLPWSKSQTSCPIWRAQECV